MKYHMLLMAGIALALVGCTSSPRTSHQPSDRPVAEQPGPVLRVEGDSVVLGDATDTPLSVQAFTGRIQQLASSGREQSAGQLVRTYPQLARQAVFSSNVAARTQATIAAWLDAYAAPAQGGWALFVADRAKNPARYSAWEKQRASAWSALRRGAFTDIADRTLATPTESPTPWPEVEATLMVATATLASGRPADAAMKFERAAQRTASWDPHVAARANLFAALSHQLAGNLNAAGRTRDAAIRRLPLSSIHDPMILRLLIKIDVPDHAEADLPSHREMLARLGRIELQRGVPHAALLAWRAAEAEPGSEPSLNRLRIGQVESLIALGQDEPAIATLIGLSRTDVRPEALVMLGLVQLRRGQADTALAVLREAVADTTAQSHPDVYADAGLVLLSTGNHKAGLSLLHEARDVYQQQGDTPALRQLLTNELHYAQAVDEANLESRVRKMLVGLPGEKDSRSTTPPSGQ